MKVYITPGMVTPSLAFMRDSALANCTAFDSDERGPFIARRWPSFSSGEEMLWSVLEWLNGNGFLPSDHDLAHGLDTPNREAVRAAIAAGSEVTA